MRINKIWILIFMSMTLLYACSSDDDNNSGDNSDIETPTNPSGPYANGFFVTNEGQFPNAGSVSFISQDLESSEQHIFETVNDEDPGSVVQSLFFDDDHAYIVANNSNMISVVDRYTFEKVGAIDEGLELPRYGVVVDGKAYVTNQAGEAYVAVIDLETLTVETTIPMEGTAEHIEKGADGLLYVQNAAFGTGNTISVIDPASNSVVNTIGTADGLNDIAVNGNHLYALTTSDIEVFDFNGNNTANIALEYDSTPSKMAVEDGEVYFTVDKSVYAFNADTDTAPDESLLSYNTDSEWGAMYGFAVHNGNIYIADAGDFASDSFIEVYDLEGNLLKKVDVGISPNGFYFND